MEDKKYPIELEVITPLSVGAGNDNEWMRGIDFVQKDGKVYVLDIQKAAEQGVDIGRLTSLFLNYDEKGIFNLIGDKLESVSKYIFKSPVSTNNSIKTFLRTQLYEKPVAYTWDPESAKHFENLDLRTDVRDTYYTSIHYVVRPNNQIENAPCCEIQVRTLFEEIWGEIDHHINYPHPTKIFACKEQLRVLAKLVSTGTRLADSIYNCFDEYKLKH